MNSVTTVKFRKAFENLPDNVKLLAKKSYEIWKTNPFYKSLRYKQVHTSKQIFSVRIGRMENFGFETRREYDMVLDWLAFRL